MKSGCLISFRAIGVMVYLLVLVYLGLNWVCFDIYKYQKRQFFYLLELVVLILFSGLSYRVGGDLQIYFHDYEIVPTINNYDKLKYDEYLRFWSYAPLWNLIFSLSKTIYSDFAFFHFLHAIFVNCGLFYIFKKYCKNYFFAVFIYFLTWSYCYYNFEILRESECILIFLLTLGFWQRKKMFLYYLVACVAFLFHYSAVMLFLMPMLFYIVGSKFNLKVVLIIITSLVLLSNLNIFIGFLFYIAKLFNKEILIVKITTYIINVETTNFNGLLFILLKAFFDVLVLCVQERKREKTFWRTAVVCHLVFTCLGIYYHTMFGRLLNYLDILLCISIVRLFDFKKTKKIAIFSFRRISTIILLFFLLNTVYFLFKGSANYHTYQLYYPYTTIIDGNVNDALRNYIYKDY